MPYVLFPDKDFSLNTADYTQNELPEPGRVDYVGSNEWMKTSFRGSYTSKPAYLYMMDGSYVYFLDSTPDCVYDLQQHYRIGAFRAYLALEYLDGGHGYIFKENEISGISDAPSAARHPSPLYDLQGRRLGGVPQRGVYIQNGKKRVVR